MTPPTPNVSGDAQPAMMPMGPDAALPRLLAWIDAISDGPGEGRGRRRGERGGEQASDRAGEQAGERADWAAEAYTAQASLPLEIDALDSVLWVTLPSARWYEHGRFRAILSPATYERVKRVLDVVVCLVALPFVLVILALLALAVRLDSPGAPFFVQHRTGRGGRRFKMYKLRTMVRNAEELKKRWAHLNELTWPDFKITDDPRMTRMGRFLRRTSLDELPQVLNVLKGDMSLVGPRPTSFGPDAYTLWHTARLEVQPGITGLWQVSGRSELDFDERLRLDIAYIRNRSLWLDLSILLRTIGAVSSGRGAS